MRRVSWCLIGYVGVVFLGAATIAPWLYQFVQALAESSPMFKSLAGAPFHRYVNRCLLIIALVGLYPLSRLLGMDGWKDLGWRWGVAGRGHVIFGIAAGLITLGFLAVLAALVGAREVTQGVSIQGFLGACTKGLATGIVVSILEETLFRGLMLGGTRRALGSDGALLLSSAVYAWVHFLKRVQHHGPITWDSGFEVLAKMMAGFTELDSLVPAFFNLFLAGMILGVLFQHSGSLMGAMALHATWVFWIKSYGYLTEVVPGASARIWGSDRLIDGWLASGVLGVLYLVVWRRRPERESENPNQHR